MVDEQAVRGAVAVAEAGFTPQHEEFQEDIRELFSRMGFMPREDIIVALAEYTGNIMAQEGEV